MGVIGIIIIGFLVGLVARFLKPGDDHMGILRTTLVGIGGAVIGSYIGQAFGMYQVGEPVGFFGAVFGAVILLALLNLAFGQRATRIR